ncbi:hypothetical protein PG984_005252 [Apiospora sp. TS-2023a]
MKYATAAAAVLPLAWAASIETRGQDSKYNVSQLEAACDSNDKCSYNFKIATGDSDATDCSMKSLMKMGAAPETKCGPYAVSAMKPHDGGLIFLIDQAGKGLSGTFTAYPKDFKSGDDDKTMSYNGGASFDVAAKAVNLKVAEGDDETPSTTGGAPKVSSIASHAAMDPPDSTTSAKLSMISSVGVGGGPVMGSTTKVASGDSTAVPTGSLKVASSGAPTAASGGSTMATATATDSSSSSSSTSTSDESSSSSSSSDSDSSSSSSDESSGATRQSAFAGVMAAVGLMAFAF